MALGHGPRVVTDGLVLALDAADVSSYPGSGTTWTDLSANVNNGTLVNGVGYDSGNGGSLSFDGANDYVSAGTSGLNLNELSICAWVKFNSITNKLFPTISNKETSNLNRNWFFGVSSSTSKLIFGRSVSGVDTGISSTENVNLNKWYYFVCTNTLTPVFSLYINGSLNVTQTFSGTLSTAGTTTWIGTYRDVIYPMNGNIAQVSIYNRALTASEIQQNFNALRGRFGI